MYMNDALSPAEHQLFTRALVLGQSVQARPVGPDRAPRFNTVVWIAEKEGDLPDWLTIDNPRLRHIPIAPPDRAARHALRFIGKRLLRELLQLTHGAADSRRESPSLPVVLTKHTSSPEARR